MAWRAASGLVLCACFALAAQSQQITAPRSAPHDGYWACFDAYLDGDFRTAGKSFRDAGRDGLKNLNLAAPGPWVDAICYHAMSGECHYQMGELPQAFEEFTAACQFYLAHREWMLKIDFPPAVEPEANVKAPPPWGVTARSTRLGHFRPRFSAFTGRLDNQNVVRKGGVIETPAYFPVYVSEIVRCTALAISRRRELLGPLSEHDPLTIQLVEALGRLPAPGNHWSQCWVQLELGLAYAAANRMPQAVAELQKSLQAMGQFDHPLTCVALLELGRFAFEQGQYEAAKTYLHEATISAYYFERRDVMEEAFRLGGEAHLLAGGKGVYPPLSPAIAALSRVRMVHTSLLVSLAEELLSAGELAPATTAVSQARSAIGRRDMGNGSIGGRLNFQAARLAAHKSEWKASNTAFEAAMTYQRAASKRNFHVSATDAAFRAGSITERVADIAFSHSLREPTHLDWLQDPLDTLAALGTPQGQAYEHWFEVALSRKDYEKAINIAERVRRRRFLATQPFGGRLLGMRWVLEAAAQVLSQEAVVERNALLVKYPQAAGFSRRSAELIGKLRELPIAPSNDEKGKQQKDLLNQLASNSASQERLLQLIALEREPCELAFPPLRETKHLQEQLPDGTAVVYYVATTRTLHAFALAKDRCAHVVAIPAGAMKNEIAEFLRQLGNYDRTQALLPDELRSTGWQATGKRLMTQLTGKTQTSSQLSDWESIRELVIVPDGVLWYLPFDALAAPDDAQYTPLLRRFPIRYSPTLSLAVDGRESRRLERSAVVGGKLLPRDEAALGQASASAIASAADHAAILGRDVPQPSSALAATLDRLVVLSDQEDTDKVPAGWAPFIYDTGRPGAALSEWLTMPQAGVEQIVLPAFHTAAEIGLKRAGNGDEIFLTTCNLLASGCRTALVSRWRVGGQSTVDLIREFVQELPHQPADVAWRRSVQLAGERPIDPALEGRVRTGASESIPGDHPFFWAGYMLVDTGAVVGSGQ